MIAGDLRIKGDSNNFKSYSHVALHISAANSRNLFVKTRPKAYPWTLLPTSPQDSTLVFIFQTIGLRFRF
jgi:hypothetical protein